MLQRLRVFISSPGDVPEERLRTDLIVDKLAQEFRRHFSIEAYRWEHEPMLASGHFQDAIEPPSAFDIVILIVWSRLGTPLPAQTRLRIYEGEDGRKPVTGTEWEYEDALQAARVKGAPDLIAFRNIRPAAVDTRDPQARAQKIEQLEALDKFWTRHFADRGMFIAAYDEYQTLEDFSERLERALRKLIERRIANLDKKLKEQRVWSKPPFRGLEAYEFEHAPIFFGRDALVAKTVEQLASRARDGTAFLLVSGGSGSGKSSLVKAALVPRLMKPQRIQGAAFLRRVVFRPGNAGKDLIAGLVGALLQGPASRDIGLPELLAPGQAAADVVEHLRLSVDSPRFVFAGALARVTESSRRTGRILPYEEAKLIVVIDQMEELFTVGEIEREERRMFVRLLAGLARSGAGWVVATMRADFWHRAADIPELIALCEREGRIDVLPPGAAELADMIRKPAEAAGVGFETHPVTNLGLDAILAQHAAAEPGVLPLLSFTLDALYGEDVGSSDDKDTPDENADGVEGAMNGVEADATTLVDGMEAPDTSNHRARLLTYATYESLGGLEGAIATRADQVVSLLPEQAKAAVPRVLRALATVPAETSDVAVSRVAPLAGFHLGSPARTVVNKLIEARLLVASNEGAVPTVRLAHEALIRCWKTANDQLTHDRRDLETRELIERQHARWVRAIGPAQRQLLLRDPDLANAVDLDRRWRDELPLKLREFIATSAAATTAEARRRWIVAAIVMLCLALLAAASIGALHIAEMQRNEALISQSRFLARDSRIAVGQGNATRGLILALEGLPRQLGNPDRPFVKEAEYALANSYANRRERFILDGHQGTVWSVAFSPDGLRVASASDDKTARLWDAKSGKALAVLRGHEDRVWSATFSPDGKHVLTTSDDQTARLWDAITGAEIVVLRGHQNAISFAAFSPDGRRVVTASDDKTARLWDVLSGAAIGVIRGHEGLVTAAAFSHDSERLATAGTDKTARIWEIRTGNQLALFTLHMDAVTSVAFSGDDTRVVTASWDHTAIVWNLKTGEAVALRGHEGQVFSAAVSPDGKRVITASADHTSRLWNIETGDLVAVLKGHEGWITSAAFSPDGKRVLTASDDRTARLWNAERGTAIAVLRGHEGLVTSAAFSPDNRHMVTVSDDRSLRLWEVEPSATIAVMQAHTGVINFAAFSSDGKRLITASADGTARLWNGETGAEIAVLIGHEIWVHAAAFSPNGRQVATASRDKTARLWNAETGQLISALSGHDNWVTFVAYSPDGKRLVTTSADGTARIWDADSASTIAMLRGHENWGIHAAFSPDGLQVVTASRDNSARTWDAATGTPLATFKGHEHWVTTVAFSPDGARLLTASWDNTARIWDVRTGEVIVVLRGHEARLMSATFSPDGKRVLTASWDETARLWDAQNGASLAVLRGHQHWVVGGSFSRDGQRVLTASWDRTARVWDAETGAPIAEFQGHADDVLSAAFSPDGLRVVTASVDTTARLWRLPPRCQALIDAGWRERLRGATAQERAQYFLKERADDSTSILSVLHRWFAPLLPRSGDTCQ